MSKLTYNKSEILKRAWKLFRNEAVKDDSTFSQCLRQSWSIAKNGIRSDEYNKVYNKYFKKVFNYVSYRINGNYDVANDITQEVFIRVHKHFEEYDVYKAKLVTWFYTIANNLIIDHFRHKALVKEDSISNFVDSETGKETFQIHANESDEIESTIENNELRIRINKAFADLKPKYKRIAELYFLEDLSYNEIADACNVPLGTVKGMVSRCREMLQKSLVDAVK